MNKELIDRALALKAKYPQVEYAIDKALSHYKSGFWDETRLLNQVIFSEKEMGAGPVADNFVADIFAPLNINMDLLNLEPYSDSTAKSYFDKIYDERKRIEKLSLAFITDNNLYNSSHRQDLNAIIYKFTKKCIEISDKFDVRKSKLEWFI